MTTDLDRMIEEALGAEDRAILDRYGEQGMFAQMAGLFQGRMGPWSLLTVVAQLAMFAIAVYAGVQFINADDAPGLARWGALAWLGATGTTVIKTWFWTQMQTNRILREVKRVELQIARLHAR
jgi:hypothetical protein